MREIGPLCAELWCFVDLLGGLELGGILPGHQGAAGASEARVSDRRGVVLCVSVLVSCDRYFPRILPHHKPARLSFPAGLQTMAQGGLEFSSLLCDACGESLHVAADGATLVDGVHCAAPRCSCAMHKGCVLGGNMFGPRAKAVEDAVNDFLTKKRKRSDVPSFYCRCVMLGLSSLLSRASCTNAFRVQNMNVPHSHCLLHSPSTPHTQQETR